MLMGFFQDPAIKVEEGYAPYTSGLEQDIFVKTSDGRKPIVGQVWPGNTVFPDFTHPNASDWWFKSMQQFHDVLPFDGLWTVFILT